MRVTDIENANIRVEADNCILRGISKTASYGGDVTFASGTSGNVIDSSTNVTVTDNGSNTVGDIA
jgi:hypothetical protein